MPELPEVEHMRIRLERMALSKKIISVHVLEQGGGPRHNLFDDKIITCDAQCLIDSLTNTQFESSGRKGKQMYINLSNKKSLLFHMGMTGCLILKGLSIPQYKSFHVSETWPPKFTKLELVFEDDVRLAFTDPRRLGKIRLLDEKLLFISPPLTKLAPDPLTDCMNAEDIHSLLQRTSAPIKAVLLNQEKVYSGIGNWIADEVFYQAEIHPSTASNRLSLEKVVIMHDKIVDIVHVAVACSAIDEDYPTHWLFHQRWRGKKAGGKMPDGSPIHFETVGGRTSAIVTPRKIKKNSSVEMPSSEMISEFNLLQSDSQQIGSKRTSGSDDAGNLNAPPRTSKTKKTKSKKDI